MRAACRELNGLRAANGFMPQIKIMSNEHNYRLDYLDQLESEAIHILREVAGQIESPAPPVHVAEGRPTPLQPALVIIAPAGTHLSLVDSRTRAPIPINPCMSA